MSTIANIALFCFSIWIVLKTDNAIVSAAVSGKIGEKSPARAQEIKRDSRSSIPPLRSFFQIPPFCDDILL